ncbi:MAG TPA: RNB domain-containing ribonuclease, partial [Candidatus Latescibacteria bacterium]|nr:RNB domain-containing ribonuclease [Candidatus Latescibacterota bacterium]
MRKSILEYLSKATRPLRKRELARKLGVSHEEYPAFRRALKELVKEGKVARLRGGKYRSIEEANRFVGRLSVHPDGYGFVSLELEGPDVFVRLEDMGPALHGDKVVVQVYGRRRGAKPEGKVIQVTERTLRQVVGVYRSGMVLPDDPRFPVVYVSGGEEAREGQKVAVRIEGGTSRALDGRVVEVLGYPGEPGLDVVSIVREFELPTEFPPQVLQEAETLPDEVPPEELSRREDLRALPALTIDPKDAKDFDDAVSLEVLGDGRYRLGVHIADVGHYVREGGEIDREAYCRGTSVYLVDRAIPMLPPELSSDLCTLHPGKDRLSMSVLVDITEEGEVLGYRIVEGVVRSKARLTYPQAQAAVDGRKTEAGPAWEFREMLMRMDSLSKALVRRRHERGAIDFDLPEPEVTLDEEGTPLEIRRRERLDSHKLIESFMLLANEIVA